ncbi:MAG: (2Fe-2S) ferredoxin domain-containing protein [Bacteroidales bacterium]
METYKTDIAICLGSSCFARGNRKLVQAVRQFLASHHLEERVFFHGAHCFGECRSGPNLKIGETLYPAIDEEKVQVILKDYFGV